MQIDEVHEGDVTATPEDPVYVRGIVNGNVIVDGGALDLVGTVSGDVVVLSGHAVINGTVGGSVLISGGHVDVYGRVGGTAIASNTGTLNVGPAARVEG